MKQTVIVITDNDDNTKQVQIHNLLPREDGRQRISKAEGSRITIPKSIVTFQVIRERQPSLSGLESADFYLHFQCLPDDDLKLYETYNPAQDVSKLTDNELLEELTERKCLTVETVYRKS